MFIDSAMERVLVAQSVRRNMKEVMAIWFLMGDLFVVSSSRCNRLQDGKE